MKLNRHYLWLLFGFFMLLFAPVTSVTADDDEHNIVAGIISAPVVMNGLVANEPTEFNIILSQPGVSLEGALDPQAKGFQIPAGGRMEVELSDEFIRNKVTGTDTPVPINPNANIILTIGPQNPIIFQSGATVARGNWAVSDDGANLITVTPLGGIGDNGLENARANEIGMKVIHVRPNPRTVDGMPFINGDPGEEGEIAVRIYNASGDVVASGEGDVKFRARVGRQVHITNEGLRTTPGGSPAVETIELIDFQRVGPGTVLDNTNKTTPFSAGYPYAPRYILFDDLDPSLRGEFTEASFIPQIGLAGVTYEIKKEKPWRAKLVQYTGTGKHTIGAVDMSGPSRDSRGKLLPSIGQTTASSDANGSFFSVPVQVGDMPGEYRVTVTLYGGGQATTTIIVE